ncbi:SURF1 family cytochrome oxidase biogenesis protein [Achromobacter xylosoxidans]
MAQDPGGVDAARSGHGERDRPAAHGRVRKGLPAQQRPDANLWYGRDLPAIAAAHGLDPVAPYFIDADSDGAARDPKTAPVGGLTVLSFPNNHLVYAITWYGLALMLLVGVALVVREERRARQRR